MWQHSLSLTDIEEYIHISHGCDTREGGFRQAENPAYSIQFRAAPSHPHPRKQQPERRTRVSPSKPAEPSLRKPGNMEQYKGMTDEELINTLKKYNIPHGPVVGTTRTLYEKKLCEIDRKKTKYSPTKSFQSSSGSYGERTQYDLPRPEEYRRRTHQEEEVDDERYQESYSVTKSFPQARQRGKVDVLDFQNKSEKYCYTENTYQNISQLRHTSSPSLTVEPRRAIREKTVEETPRKRFLPLWLQFLLLLFFVGFLAFVYFFVQETDENPFVQIND
ncbi:emerin isoform X1 [Ascaphus truei]|uniref:emerin isoform X1 n=2 Tax=Ascaphus truei TaxID=8439 RepID=UPI003F59D372